MPNAGDQPHIGSARRVVDLVVGLVEQGNYRSARMHLHSLELREGLLAAAEIVARITAPPAGVDPRIGSQAQLSVPDMLPEWLAGPVHDEIARICTRQEIRVVTAPQLLGRILAASIVDAAAPGPDVPDLLRRAHLDLRDGHVVDEVADATIVDVSGGRGSVHVTEPTATAAPAERSLTDWLGRRVQ